MYQEYIVYVRIFSTAKHIMQSKTHQPKHLPSTSIAAITVHNSIHTYTANPHSLAHRQPSTTNTEPHIVPTQTSSSHSHSFRPTQPYEHIKTTMTNLHSTQTHSTTPFIHTHTSNQQHTDTSTRTHTNSHTHRHTHTATDTDTHTRSHTQ